MLVISDSIVAEYRDAPTKRRVDKLFERAGITAQEFRAVIDALCDKAELHIPTGDIPECRDESDRKYLHCAQSAEVDYIVTFDTDIFAAAGSVDVEIVTPGQFLSVLRGTQ